MLRQNVMGLRLPVFRQSFLICNHNLTIRQLLESRGYNKLSCLESVCYLHLVIMSFACLDSAPFHLPQ